MADVLDSARGVRDGDVVLTVIAGRPVTKRLEQPAARFGRRFAHENGTDYQRHAEPVLTRWLKGLPWKNVKA